MKCYKMSTQHLGKLTLPAAFDIVFGEDTLQSSHSKLTTTPWQNDKRTTEFYVQLDMIPRALRHIFQASGVLVTTEQVLTKYDNCWKVTNNIKLHFIGARFFKVNSHFELQQTDDDIVLNGELKCNAWLIPPLNMIAESFMLQQCKKEINTYTEVVTRKLTNSVK